MNSNGVIILQRKNNENPDNDQRFIQKIPELIKSNDLKEISRYDGVAFDIAFSPDGK